MLEPDDKVGYLLRPGMSFAKRQLGFSIDANRFGLRGPDFDGADNVIMGTSYGMGFGVDVGLNWYDLALNAQRWFNAALPVGPMEWCAILDRYYRGNYGHALFIYHPNFMQHGVAYLKWKKTGRNVFDYMGWQTSWLKCAKMRLRNLVRHNQRLNDGSLIYYREKGVKYKINGRYVVLDDRDFKYFNEVSGMLLRLLKRFDRVTVLCVKIKEELVPEEYQTQCLKASLKQYDVFWNVTRMALEKHESIEFYDAPEFGLSAYNPYDTHWNALGNRLFADYISREFNNFE